MVALNANNTTWYVLRYPEDYATRDPSDPRDPFGDPSIAYLDDDLYYDADRGALELVPRSPAAEAEPLPGLAVTASGVVLRSDPWNGRIITIECDGRERDLVCEPNVLAQPAGLAIDRRGYLYVADPAAKRVVVLSLPDGYVVASLGGLQEPVDVAVAPNGRIYVADRAAGEIVVFTPRMALCHRFEARGGSGLPERPRPIAVMIDSEGQVVVADAVYPRLLRFDRLGEPQAALSLPAAAVGTSREPLSVTALPALYGAEHVRALATECFCLPSRDVGVALAEVHFKLRVLRLLLSRRFAERGQAITRALDSGRPGTTWHKLEIDAEIPNGTQVHIETASADTLDVRRPDWSAAGDSEGRPISFSTEVPDQLIFSVPGRYLWLRVTLIGAGTSTPSVRAIRPFYPRTSYTDLLPAVFVSAPEAAEFLPRFLALFERVFTGIEDRYERFSRELNPDVAPRDVIDWLAGLVDLCLDPSWPLPRRRKLVANAMDLYERRGTAPGIARYLEIYIGRRPVLIESFLERPAGPPVLGRGGNVLGCGLALIGCDPDATPEDLQFARHAHRFTVFLPVDDPCDEELVAGVVERILATSKPAHTVHELRIVRPSAAVGLQSRIGIDLVLGAGEATVTQLADPTAPTPLARRRGSTLGVNAILGNADPTWLRSRTPEL